MLGKRKRETVVLRRTQVKLDGTSAANPIDDGANDVFRKYFEASFTPLPESNLATPSLETDDRERDDGIQHGLNSSSIEGDEDAASDWSGISDAATQAPIIEVVDHAVKSQSVDDDAISRIFHKSFMSSKPPRDMKLPAQPSSVSESKAEDDREEKANLKNDLDLQRLLRESHLLDQKNKKPDNGGQRHKATDLRLQNLGSKTSLFAQEKMPMSHRKGITLKASSQEAQRRKEAKENGVILEKSSKKSSTTGSRRDRGVDVPVVGKFKGGTLQLSRRDVASIQGPRRAGSKRGRR